MRIYRTFEVALNEIKRELKEMGIVVHTKSVQNKDITNNPEYQTFELQNYTYTVSSPNYNLIALKNPSWADMEFLERVSGHPHNPGVAWLQREETWRPFLKSDGTFDYTYPERLTLNLETVIAALDRDNSTRRAFLPVFDRQLDNVERFKTRIPCTIGYWFYYRQGKLHVTYLQRSADFGEHFNYDIYLADRLKHYVATQLNLVPGTFTHWVGSLHVFAKDVEGVF